MDLVGRASEVAIRHRQVKPTSQFMNLENMVLKLTKSTS